jgi:hypothetical protein
MRTRSDHRSDFFCEIRIKPGGDGVTMKTSVTSVISGSQM